MSSFVWEEVKFWKPVTNTQSQSSQPVGIKMFHSPLQAPGHKRSISGVILNKLLYFHKPNILYKTEGKVVPTLQNLCEN